jgi:hypothetical protein
VTTPQPPAPPPGERLDPVGLIAVQLGLFGHGWPERQRLAEQVVAELRRYGWLLDDEPPSARHGLGRILADLAHVRTRLANLEDHAHTHPPQ